jgi:hypothetical protein
VVGGLERPAERPRAPSYNQRRCLGSQCRGNLVGGEGGGEFGVSEEGSGGVVEGCFWPTYILDAHFPCGFSSPFFIHQKNKIKKINKLKTSLNITTTPSTKEKKL